MEDDGIFYGHLIHFTAFCYILWTFGVIHGNLVYFPVLVFCTKKNFATLDFSPLSGYKQCVQIGRFFVCWAIVFFRHFLICRSGPNIWTNFFQGKNRIIFDKMGLAEFWAIYS
jgi:hypothetical protein